MRSADNGNITTMTHAPAVARIRAKARRWRLIALFAAFWTLAPVGYHSVFGAYRELSGNLRSYLLDICIPPSGTEAFQEPSQADMDDWQQVIADLLAGNYQAAADLADWLLYDLVKFTDTGTGCDYYVLIEHLCPGIACFSWSSFEEQPCRGLGTYVYNPHSRRAINLQVPHAKTDDGTWPESVAAFLELQTTFLQVTGVTRCSNAAPGCGGETSACGGTGPYRESDVAHYTENYFQVASTEVHNQLPDLVSISVHGFGACSSAEGTSIAQISGGTGTGGNCSSSAVPNGIATRLAARYNSILASLPNAYPGRGAGSCNWAPGEPADLDVVGCPIFCGGSNVQGRVINGSTGYCPSGVCDAPDVERFIHLEQQLPLRIPPPGLPWPYPYPGLSWQVSIDAIGNTLPTHEIWADFSYSGAETGSYCQPYGTLTRSVNAANPGEAILIKTGSTPGPHTIAAPVVLHSYGGAVVLGR